MRKPLNFTRPSTTVLVTAAIAAVIAASGTAYAAKLITGAQIANGSLTGADIKENSLTGSDIKSGSVSTADLSAPAKTALDGKDGADGAQGPKGDTGAKGDAGTNGAKGDKGDKGDTGSAGAPGAPGTPAPAAEYGVGGVWVTTGNPVKTQVPWGRFVTSALPVVGDLQGEASGTFRFTCTSWNPGPCDVTLSGAIASAASADGEMHAHLTIRKDGETGPFCFYGEVGDQAGTVAKPRVGVDRLPASTNFFAEGATVPNPVAFSSSSVACGVTINGANTAITVPDGRYTVDVAFRFWA